MKIVLPVAGRGYRFEPLTDWLPKCLVPVRQRPLIAWAVNSLAFRPHELVIVANERERHILDPAFDAIFDRKVIRVWTPDTAGAPHTVLRAREHIDNADELLIITPDLAWDAPLDEFTDSDAAAGLVVTTQPRSEPVALQRKYSYCRADAAGRVIEVIEKPAEPLELANVGVYWWRHGADFIRHADAHLRDGRTVNGEHYIAPIYNDAIAAGLRVATVAATKYVNLGSAERAAQWEGWA